MKMPFRKVRKTEPEQSALDIELDVAIHKKSRADERFEETNKVFKQFIRQIDGKTKNA